MTGAPAPRRQLRVEHVMGTTVSIDVREPFVEPRALEAAIAWLHDVDDRFTMYRDTSEMHRLATGRLRFEDASPDVRAVVTLADDLCARTDGYFDARRHRADGLLDPSGVVKGWSVDEAVAGLRLAGARNFQVAVGGDLVVAGEPEPGRAWRIGIRHPDLPGDTAAILEVSDLAVATSALYERGGHIRDPHTGEVPAGLRSLTVVGPALTITDAFATAAFAMGEPGIAWVARQPGYGALGITRLDRVVWTSLVDSILVAPGGEPGRVPDEPPASHAPLSVAGLTGDTRTEGLPQELSR
jgi:thiamine biosynthesis lipoprotein